MAVCVASWLAAGMCYISLFGVAYHVACAAILCAGCCDLLTGQTRSESACRCAGVLATVT